MVAPTVASLWFITPAWRRLALSAVCFEQRREVIEELAASGIEAHCVVIADDENLELARAMGFDTVERDNDYLGRRFNDGFQYAAEHGADWIVPVGSDSWVQAAYFTPVPDSPATIRTASYLCTVTLDRLAHLEIKPNNGGGPYMIHRSLLPAGFRPAQELLSRGTDRSTVNGLRQVPAWEMRDLSRFQHISFRGEPHITAYHRLWYHWGVREERDPWEQLPLYYAPALVEAAHEALH